MSSDPVSRHRHVSLDQLDVEIETDAALKKRKIVWAEDMARLKRLMRYVKPYRWRMAGGLATGAMFGAINGLFPRAIKFVFHALFESDVDASPMAVLLMGLIIPGYFAVRGALGYLNSFLIASVGTSMLRDLRTEVFNHLQKLSLDFFVRNKTAQLTQRVSQSTGSMQRLALELSDDLVKQPITIIVVVVTLARMNAWFCVVGLVLGVLCMIPMRYFGRKIRNAAKSEEASEGALMAVLYESLTSIGIVKAYRLEAEQEKKFAIAANRSRQRAMRIRAYKDALSPLIEVIASLGIMAALFYAYREKVSYSDFSAIIAGFYVLYNPLKSLGKVHLQSQRVLAISQRVFAVLDTEPSVQDKPTAKSLPGVEHGIRYENVSLTYTDPRRDNAPVVLEDINLTIPRGSVCALVGRSGAGKTSLVNLLLRFYNPDRGRILVDDRPLEEFTVASVRDRIGLVTQETVLFADTVANNIGFGRLGATREQITQAARRAHADEFIRRLAHGYDTELSDRGQDLSAGQRQRIAIARAFLRDPAILILDEATSALDAESERLVQDAMTDLMRGRTVILIAHRLSTVRAADQIVVLDQGRIIEQGSHDELMRQDGIYRRFSALQMLPE